MKREIVKRALAGEALNDLNIVDAHCHLHNLYEYYNPEAKIDDMVEEADRIGISYFCISPIEGIFSSPDLGNRHMKEAIMKYPDRVKGYMVINPNFPELYDSMFDTYYNLGGVLGIKIHPTAHNYNLCDENYIKAFDRVNDLGGIVLSHSWQSAPSCSVDLCEQVIKAYPKIPFIIGHSGGTTEGILKSISVVNKYENAYMDTCGTFLSCIRIEEMAAKADSGKILFSSDSPYHDPRVELCNILLADIEDDLKINMLGGNFRKMLNSCIKPGINEQ